MRTCLLAAVALVISATGCTTLKPSHREPSKTVKAAHSEPTFVQAQPIQQVQYVDPQSAPPGVQQVGYPAYAQSAPGYGYGAPCANGNCTAAATAISTARIARRAIRTTTSRASTSARRAHPRRRSRIPITRSAVRATSCSTTRRASGGKRLSPACERSRRFDRLPHAVACPSILRLVHLTAGFWASVEGVGACRGCSC
jgi:hypothetical protein